MTSIEIKEGRYFARYWFFSGVDFDWLCALWRDLPDGQWTVQYRFRYVVDDRLDLTSEDEKSWWTATFPRDAQDEAVVESLVQNIAEQVRALRIEVAGACSDLQTVALRSSSVDECFTILARQPWNHVVPTQKGGSA